MNIYRTYYSPTPGRLCILLEDAEDNVPFATLSVNVPEYHLAPDEFVVINDSENSTLAPQLYDFHRFEHTRDFVELCFCNNSLTCDSIKRRMTER